MPICSAERAFGRRSRTRIRKTGIRLPVLALLAIMAASSSLAQEGSSRASSGAGPSSPLPAGPAVPFGTASEGVVSALPDIVAGEISQPVDATGQNADLPHDLSPVGMFLAADWVVKTVMIGLALASLATWIIWVAKTIELACARGRAGNALKTIRSSSTLDNAVGAMMGRGGPAALMLRSAREEVALSEAAISHAGGRGLKERVASGLRRIEAHYGRRISKGTGILATIGSIAPFVGLFGTVWGIMNSFIGISESQTTNLAIVAPGIAEALLATAIGLVAAIPAVVIYNTFARSVTGYRQLLSDAAAGVEILVSRDLDFLQVPNPAGGQSRFASAAE